MKLILTSDRIGKSRKIRKEFVSLLDKPVEENNVLIVYTLRKKKDIKYARLAIKDITNIGITRKKIILANISNKPSKNLLKEIDVIYVCGGNTFYILDRLRKTGFDNLIRKLVKKNKVYIGVSAGSILVGKSIKLAGEGSEGDLNDMRLKNFNAFNFTNIAVFPHYKEKLKKEVDDFKKKVNYPVEKLKDGEAIIIIKNKVRKITK